MLSLVATAALGVAIRLPWGPAAAPMPAAASRAAARMTTTVRETPGIADGHTYLSVAKLELDARPWEASPAPTLARRLLLSHWAGMPRWCLSLARRVRRGSV